MSEAMQDYQEGKKATGVESGLLQHLGRVVASYGSRVSEMEDEVGDLKDKIQELKDERDNLESERDALRQFIADISKFKDLELLECCVCDALIMSRKNGKERARYEIEPFGVFTFCRSCRRNCCAHHLRNEAQECYSCANQRRHAAKKAKTK